MQQTTLDRGVAPAIAPFSRLKIPQAELIHLDNGIPLYVVNMGSQEVSRLDIMFSAGKCDETTPVAAEMTNLLLKEGVVGMSSAEIAEQLDFYGAWLQPFVSHHNSYITLYSLNRFFEQTLSVVEKMVKYPTFPEQEFQTIVNRRSQQLQLELERVQNIAVREFAPYYFGENHPYGKKREIYHYEALTTSDLRQYHQTNYTQERCRIVFTGNITPSMLEEINKVFGKEMPTNKKETILTSKLIHTLPTQHRLDIEKERAVQCAIRMALPVVNRSHPDYNQLRVVNALFGGYFGSRLNTNIREEKGYTYGIHSAIASYPLASYLTLSTQTATTYKEPLITEVYNEANKLRNTPVSATELTMVKSYMAGELARLFDGVFSIADAYVSLLANELPFDYFERQLTDILAITPERIQELANSYLDPANFYTVVVG